ncbi:uncharacterized protein LOC131243176 [Magnolia sinica]|uniref:uncharacterized protein LOC131243176 n=1 Tax=Magnolia sinica TaxID=86752 RepID=UPI00265AEBDE|nr:uncharacterized protein LOC131243176 [Magnolia sinica]
MSSGREKRRILSSFFLALIFSFLGGRTADAQVAIPPRYDGFLYKGHYPGPDSIIIDAFFDPVCPDSRDSWPPLKEALKHYSHRVSLFVHPFPLPYHDNAYVTCRALHIANKLNASTTYPLLELFFKHQEKYYNKPTHTKSRALVVDHVVKLMLKVVGNSSLSAVESAFEDRQTDLTTRISFKYGCSRGVTGTPFFFVNGFPLPDSGSALDYNKWRSIIDPLLGEHKGKKEDTLHFFL